MAEVWFMALLASWWSRQTRSLHSWFSCLCRCWRPYTGSKQWQRQQLNRPQDQAEHQTQVLVGVIVPPPPPLLAVTTHRMGEGDYPQLFLETTQAISERASVPRQNGRHGCCCSLRMLRQQLWACRQPRRGPLETSDGTFWIAWAFPRKTAAGGSGVVRWQQSTRHCLWKGVPEKWQILGQ